MCLLFYIFSIFISLHFQFLVAQENRKSNNSILMQSKYMVTLSKGMKNHVPCEHHRVRHLVLHLRISFWLLFLAL